MKSERTCFNNATILYGDDFQILSHQSLLVQDGQILGTGEPDLSARQINLEHKLICPMFINAHTHLGDIGAKELGIGLPLPEVVNPPNGLKHRFLNSISDLETHIEMMRHGLQECLHNGIIAVADFREQGLPGVRALRQAASGLPLTVVALGRMAESASVLEMEAEAHSILAEADGLGVRDVDSYPMDLMKKLRRVYPQKIFAAHAAENEKAELDSIRRTGRGQVEQLLEWQPDFLVHLVHASAEALRLMAGSGIMGVSCPRCNGILGSGQPKLGDWAKYGLHFALGTDNGMFNSPDILREMDFASRMSRGSQQNPSAVDSLTILQSATIEGARALKLDQKLGSLDPGKDASFIVFNLNSLNLKYQQNVISAIVHRAGPADIAQIYIKGELY